MFDIVSSSNKSVNTLQLSRSVAAKIAWPYGNISILNGRMKDMNVSLHYLYNNFFIIF